MLILFDRVSELISPQSKFHPPGTCTARHTDNDNKNTYDVSVCRQTLGRVCCHFFLTHWMLSWVRQIFATAAQVLSPYVMEHSLSIELQDLPTTTANGTSVSNIAATAGQAGLENEEVRERIDLTCFMQPAAQWWVRFGSVPLRSRSPSTTYCAYCCKFFSWCISVFRAVAIGLLHASSVATIGTCGSRWEKRSDSRSFVFLFFFLFQFTCVDCYIHWAALWFEELSQLSLRSDFASLFSRRQHVREPVALRRNSFCLGIAALVSTLSIMTFWDCVREQQTFFAYWVGFRMLLLPVLLQPYIGTVLLLELEMHELTVRLEEVVDSNDVLACRGLLQEIANVKGKWASFLRQQLVSGMLAPGIYGLLVFFTVTNRDFAKDPLARVLFVSTLDAPFLLTSVCLHCSFLAMFNARVVKWQQETENNDIYRFLCQKESEFCFSILGYSVTVAKLRFSLISLLVTVLSRLAQKVILWFQDLFDLWCMQLAAVAAQQLCRCFCLKRVPTWTSWKWPSTIPGLPGKIPLPR